MLDMNQHLETVKNLPVVARGRTWWSGLSEQDRRALGLLAAFLVAFMVWAFIWQPVQGKLAAARSSLEREQELLVWVRSNEAEARQLTRKQDAGVKPLMGGSLLTTVGSTARNYNIALKRFEPSGEDKVRIWVEQVPFQKVMQWVDDIAKEYGIMVDQISMDRSRDTEGMVDLRMTLRA